MKKKNDYIISIVVILACGIFVYMKSKSSPMKNDSLYYYSVHTDYNRPDFYNFRISGWDCLILPGNTASVSVPIPESVTFRWKTALPGGKEYYENLNEFPEPNEDGSYPEVEMYPADLFQDHKVTYDLTNKIPQPFQGDIFFTVNDVNDVILKYIERQRIENPNKYKPINEYKTIVVNNQSTGEVIYDFKGTGWPLYSFYGLDIKSGHYGKGYPSTIPPKETTLTWKTALEGGKEYYDNFDEIISKPNETYRLERYPSDKFKEHQVTVKIDTKKIVEYSNEVVEPGQWAQLIFYVYDNDRVEIEYRRSDE